MTRHDLRECIFKIVFTIPFDPEDSELNGDYVISEIIEHPENTEISENFMERDVRMSGEDESYIRRRVGEIKLHLPEIDEIINADSEGWSCERLGKEELAILRLAIYEIRFDDDIPDKVAVNEALNLAHEYCDDKAAHFINGVLSTVIGKQE